MKELKDLVVLYLEDEVIIRTLLASILSKRVKEVISVSNGLEGLEALKNNEVDVIITDLDMPDMDGVEFLQEKKKLGHLANTIIMSGYEEESEDFSLADCVMAKPLNKSKLLEVLEEFALKRT